VNGFSAYEDEEGEVYDQIFSEGRNGERKALANTLTKLRNATIKGRDDYLEALDAVAKAHNIRTDTIVRYIA
jgi:hypothetical protein